MKHVKLASAATALIALIILTSFTARAATIEYRSCGAACTSLNVLSGISLDLGFGNKTYDMFIAWNETFPEVTAHTTVSIPTNQYRAFTAITAVDQALRDLDYYITAEHGEINLHMAYGPENSGYSSAYWISLNDSDVVKGTFVARSGSPTISTTGTSLYPLVFFTETAPVPIPGAVWLLGSGLFGLVAVRRRKKI